MVHRVVHDGRVYEAGDEAELPEKDAKALLAVGAVVKAPARRRGKEPS